MVMDKMILITGLLSILCNYLLQSVFMKSNIRSVCVKDSKFFDAVE